MTESILLNVCTNICGVQKNNYYPLSKEQHICKGKIIKGNGEQIPLYTN